MAKTKMDIEIEESYVRTIMDRYGVRTKTEAVNLTLRHPAGLPSVDIRQAASNIDLGAAILRDNLERYHGNLVNALVAYYAGPDAVTDWAHLPSDAQRYVIGIYALALAFDKGQGPA